VVDDVSLTTHLLAQLVRHVRNDVRQHTRQQQHNVLQRTTLQTTTSLPQCTGLWPLYTTVCVSRHPQLSFTGHMPLLTASGVSVLERKRQRSPQRCYLLPVPLAHLWQCTAVNYNFSQVAQLLYSSQQPRDHITPLLASLHWLIVTASFQFRIALLTLKALTTHQPSPLTLNQQSHNSLVIVTFIPVVSISVNPSL